MTANATDAQTAAYHYPRSLFTATGVELEYMVVDRDSLDVRPIVDELFKSFVGEYVSDVEPEGDDGEIGWSNELALHVVELKTIDPVSSLDGLADRFQSHVQRINTLLEPMDARLLPGAAHPWMNPATEMRLWPHEYNPVYEAFNRIFSCRGHGWANLQSTHINLPFANDEEFGRLHAAIRLVLPLIPALAASSPILDGLWAPIADRRLEVYRTNSARVPSIAARVIPEPVFTRRDYEEVILGRIYTDLAPLDPDNILRHEWANARGCIARFDRGAIEIRVIDIQECPKADLALTALVVATVRALVEERWCSFEQQKRVEVEPLHRALLDTIRYAERTRISEAPLLRAFGFSQSLAWAGDMWASIQEQVLPDHPEFTPTIRSMLRAGSLSSRISNRIGRYASREELHWVYSDLADCLAEGTLFDAPAL